MAKVRVGVFGCGAAAEIGHLPAIAADSRCELAALIDIDRRRLERLARSYPSAFLAQTYATCEGRIDAAVLALPHHLHAPVACELLNAGVHVLVDKPMALTGAECDAMIEAARASDRVLAVGLMRRGLVSSRLAKTFIDSGMLGEVQAFRFAEGGVYNWPVASDFFFRRRTAGGGVLVDTGAHTLDLLLWWLGDVASVEYFDDREGEDGVEADCLMRLVMESGADGVVELSRTRSLSNTAFISGSLADMEVDLRKNWVALYPKNGPKICAGNLALGSEITSLEGHKAINGGARISLSSESFVGRHSIDCDAEAGRNAGHAFGTADARITMPVEALSEYTAHVYLKGVKGDFENVPLLLRVGTADFKYIKSVVVKLTNDWKRHSLTFSTGPGARAVSLAVWKKDDPTPIRWLADGFQLEKGGGRGYYGPPRAPIVFDSMGADGEQSFTSLFQNQIASFLDAVLGAGQSPATGIDGRRSVALVERMYRESAQLKFEWRERRVFAHRV